MVLGELKTEGALNEDIMPEAYGLWSYVGDTKITLGLFIYIVLDGCHLVVPTSILPLISTRDVHC